MDPGTLKTWAIRGPGAPAPYGWADGWRIKAPAGFFPGSSDTLDVVASPARSFGPADVEALRERAAWTLRPPLSSRLPFPYHRVPAWLRTMAARTLGRGRAGLLESPDFFPMWPLDLSVDFLSDLLAPPAGSPGPGRVLVTHDLDTEEGLSAAVRKFLALEERYGARSLNFLVPRRWTLDHGLLGELTSRGHRLGIHGYDHANKTPFCAEAELRRRIEAALPLVERYAIKGYRAPSLCRTPALFDQLARHYAYDSSIPTSGGLFPMPGNGCATARPFRLRGLLELPLSMPRDGSLLFLRRSPEEILALWKDCALRLARSGGLIVLLTHCEERFSGGAAMFAAYERFLAFVRESSDLVFVGEKDVLDAPLR